MELTYEDRTLDLSDESESEKNKYDNGYINGRNKNHDNNCLDKYDKHVVTEIKTVYVLALIVWLFIIFFMGLIKNDIIIFLILLIPVLVFAINFISAGEFTCKVEQQMFKGNFLYFGFIVAVILINWNKDMSATEKHDIFRIIVLSLILLMFSMIDIWISLEEQAIIKHIRTSLHTISLTLLAYALYEFYLFQGHHSLE